MRMVYLVISVVALAVAFILLGSFVTKWREK